MGTLNYKNTAEDRLAIHLKLYIFMSATPTPLPIERMLIMNALIILNGSWSQDLILVFSLYLIQVSFLCSAMCYRMQYLIISHFSFHAQRVKKF